MDKKIDVIDTEKSILKICMEKGFLLDKEMLDLFSKLDEASAKNLIDSLSNLKIEERVITKNLFSKNFQKIRSVLIDGETKTVIENLFVNLGYSRTEIQKKGVQGVVEDVSVEDVGVEKEEKGNYLKLLSLPSLPPRKISVPDFVNHFKTRYNQLSLMLQKKD